MRSWRLTAVLCCLTCLWGSRAWAFRPFDSTDASVADRGEMEIECGPFGYIVDADGSFLVIPAAILNVGVTSRWEIVVEARNFLRLANSDRDALDTLREPALSIKGVLRRGSLQNRRGPSIAVEAGMLLPDGIERGVGTSVAGIVSQRFSLATVHLNGRWLMTHEHTTAGSFGGIVEGPSRWKLRPVAELTVARESGETASAGLLGAIWQVRRQLSIDAGWRVERSGGEHAREFRAGFTWTFPLGSGGATERPEAANRPTRWRSRA